MNDLNKKLKEIENKIYLQRSKKIELNKKVENLNKKVENSISSENNNNNHEEETEVTEITITGKEYYISTDIHKNVYKKLKNEEVGKIIGKYINNKLIRS